MGAAIMAQPISDAEMQQHLASGSAQIVPTAGAISDAEMQQHLSSGAARLIDSNSIMPIAQEAPSELESLGRGALQGASLGFSDELGGAGSAAYHSLLQRLGIEKNDNTSFSDKYTKERDAERAANEAAKQANPKSYLTGDLGAGLGLGLASGGAGLLATGGDAVAGLGAKEAIAAALKEGGAPALKALTAIGAAEGTAQGIGRSNADLGSTQSLKDAGTGFLVGAAAPTVLMGAGKLAKGALSLADTVTDAIPGVGGIKDQLGKVGSHLKDVFNVGSENVDRSLPEVAQENLDKVTDSAKEIADSGKTFETGYKGDLTAAQTATQEASKGDAQTLSGTVKTLAEKVGKALGDKDVEIQTSLEGKLPDITSNVSGEVTEGKFNFDKPVADAMKLIGTNPDNSQLTTPVANQLRQIIKTVQTGDYQQAQDGIGDLGDLIWNIPDTRIQRQLIGIKEELQKTIQSTLKSVDSDIASKYAERTGLSDNYSLLKRMESSQPSAKTGLGLDPTAQMAPVQQRLSMISDPGNPFGADYKNLLQEGTSQFPELTAPADRAVQSSGKWFNLTNNPEVGTNNLGPNEEGLAAYKNTFGGPKELGVPSKIGTAVEGLPNPAKTVTSNQNQEDTINYIKNHMFAGKPQEAQDFIDKLMSQVKASEVTSAGLGDSPTLQGLGYGRYRAVRKLADPIAFSAGQGVQKWGNAIDSTGLNSLTPLRGLNIINAERTKQMLTTPQPFKDSVQAFKDSQNQGGSSDTGP